MERKSAERVLSAVCVSSVKRISSSVKVSSVDLISSSVMDSSRNMISSFVRFLSENMRLSSVAFSSEKISSSSEVVSSEYRSSSSVAVSSENRAVWLMMFHPLSKSHLKSKNAVFVTSFIVIIRCIYVTVVTVDINNYPFNFLLYSNIILPVFFLDTFDMCSTVRPFFSSHLFKRFINQLLQVTKLKRKVISGNVPLQFTPYKFNSI